MCRVKLYRGSSLIRNQAALGLPADAEGDVEDHEAEHEEEHEPRVVEPAQDSSIQTTWFASESSIQSAGILYSKSRNLVFKPLGLSPGSNILDVWKCSTSKHSN